MYACMIHSDCNRSSSGCSSCRDNNSRLSKRSSSSNNRKQQYTQHDHLQDCHQNRHNRPEPPRRQIQHPNGDLASSQSNPSTPISNTSAPRLSPRARHRTLGRCLLRIRPLPVHNSISGLHAAQWLAAARSHPGHRKCLTVDLRLLSVGWPLSCSFPLERWGAGVETHFQEI